MRNDLVDNIRLNMNAEQVRACVYVRAGDTRARTLHFTIVKDGKVVDMTDLVIAELVILKPDGHECDQSMTRYGNELHYTLRTQDINVPGDNRAQVQMTFSDGTVYESPEFSIMVYDKLDPRYETSTNEYTALNAKLALADETVEDAQEALDAAEALLDDAEDLRDEMVQLKDDTEGFKNDASQSASDASGYASDASGYATSASGSATLSESWAVGGTNTRAGEDTNNSKYFSQQASNSASSASGSATAAAGSATSAESWAVGGTGTRAGEDTNNAKYWSDTSSGAASDALLYKNDAYNSEQDAASHASDALGFMNYASGYATEAESWAVGGTGTRPGEDTNNAKYWATQATVNDGTLTITQNGTPLGTFTANSASNVSIEVPGGGGGGHTIIDPDGQDMTQRANMQFTGDGVSVTDDAVNGKTIVDISPDAGDISYDPTTSGLSATDVQAAVDEIVTQKLDIVSGADISTLSGAICTYSKFGNIVTVVLNTGTGSLNVGTWNTIGQLPAGARPATGFYTLCMNNNQTTADKIPAQMMVQASTGNVRVWPFYSGVHIGIITFAL